MIDATNRRAIDLHSSTWEDPAALRGGFFEAILSCVLEPLLAFPGEVVTWLLAVTGEI